MSGVTVHKTAIWYSPLVRELTFDNVTNHESRVTSHESEPVVSSFDSGEHSYKSTQYQMHYRVAKTHRMPCIYR